MNVKSNNKELEPEKEEKLETLKIQIGQIVL